MFRSLVLFACVTTVAATSAPAAERLLPPDLVVTLTNDSMTVLDANGRILSTALACPGYEFAQFGASGPKFSPDQHWILVDILGPLDPGNVGRNHAIVDVRTGGYVVGSDFPRALGVAATTKPVSWASGRFAALRYDDGTVSAPIDPGGRRLPVRRCDAPARSAKTTP